MQDFLNDKNIKNTPEVARVVKEANQYWEEYEGYLVNLLTIEDAINRNMSYVHEKNVQLLNAMDEAVWLYTEHSESKNDMFIKFQYMALIFGLIIILYTIVMTKEIIHHLDSFVQKAKELATGDIMHIKSKDVTLHESSEDELKEASCHISLFVQKVNLAMMDSEEALKKAENAVSQLRQIAEEVEDAIVDMGINETEKRQFDKNVNATEDIAIQSAENLIHVNKMLQRLKKSLNSMVESSASQTETKG